MRWQKIHKDLMLAGSSQAFYKLVGFVVLATLARYLSKDDMGAFFFAATLAGLVALPTQLGLGSYLTREVAMRPESAPARLGEVLSIRLPLFALYLLGLNGFALVFLRDRAWIVLLTSVYVMLDELYRTYGAVFLGLGRIAYNVVGGVGSRLLLVALVLGAVWLGAGLGTVVGCYIVANGALLAAGHVFLVFRVGRCRLVDPRTVFRRLAGQGLPFFALAVLSLIHFKVDSLMLGFLRTYALVATYEAAYRLLEASRFVVLPLTMILFPHLSTLAARREWRPFRTLLSRTLVTSCLAGAVLTVVTVLLAGVLIPLVYGDKYVDSILVLRILYLCVPVLYVTTVSMTAAGALHLERRTVVAQVVGLALNVTLNAVAIPVWGATGAAVTTLVSETVVCVWVTRLTLRGLRSRYPSADAEALGGVDDAR